MTAFVARSAGESSTPTSCINGRDSVRASLDARYDSSMRWVEDEEAFDAWAHGANRIPVR